MSSIPNIANFVGPIINKQNYGSGDTTLELSSGGIPVVLDTVKEVVIDVAAGTISKTTGLSEESSAKAAEFLIDIIGNNIPGMTSTPSKPAGTTGYGGGGNNGISIDTSANNTSANNPRLAVYLDEAIKISIQTNIPNNGYDSKYNSNIENHYSSCHINGGYMQLSSGYATLFNFIQYQLMPAYQGIIQRNLSFSMPTSITATRLIEYFTLVLESLQLFYYHSSTFAFTNNPKNFCEAINYERSQLTADDALLLGNLKFFLGTIPIPPNIKLLCGWFCQIYATSEMSGSALLRFNPLGFVSGNGNAFKTSTSRLTSIIAAFNTYTDITNILSKAFPDWVEPIKDSSPVALIDENWKTLWSNFLAAGSTGAGVQNIFLPNINNTEVYSNFSETLDGLVPSLYSYYFGSAITPGFLSPTLCPGTTAADYKSNQVSFISTSTTKGYINSYLATHARDAAPRTHRVMSVSSSNSHILDGSAPFSGVLASANSSVYQFLEWLVSFDYMKSSKANLTKVNPNKGRSKKGGYK